jgi:hypothetical protein
MNGKSVQMNIRVPIKLISELDRLADDEHASRLEITRQLLIEGIRQRKQARALRLYREGKASKSRAAAIAGISLWEMMDLIDHADVPATITIQDAIDQVRRLVAQVPHTINIHRPV